MNDEEQIRVDEELMRIAKREADERRCREAGQPVSLNAVRWDDGKQIGNIITGKVRPHHYLGFNTDEYVAVAQTYRDWHGWDDE